MKPMIVALLVLAGTLSQTAQANHLLDQNDVRDRRLLDGLLGGLLGGGGNGGGGGGLLGGLLGGKNGLLGGLLGGGGGLLGGLLGKDGLLGGLLGGGKGGLLGGLLGGGEGGGLLGGLLGNTPLGKLLNTLFCLIEQLGLSVVLDLLNSLGADKLLGLNAIACKLETNSTAAGLLEKMIGLLDVDIVTEAGVEAIVKLDQLLTKEGIVDYKEFLQKVLCLIKQVGLADVVDAIELVGVAGVIRINDASCPNNNPTETSDAALRATFRKVLPALLKLVGLEDLLKLISKFGVISLARLGSLAMVDGTIQAELLTKIFCISGSVGVGVAVKLVEVIGTADVLALHPIICPDGNALSMPNGVDPSFLVSLLGTCKKGTSSECLNAMNAALTSAGKAACPFCELTRHPDIVKECTLHCSRGGRK